MGAGASRENRASTETLWANPARTVGKGALETACRRRAERIQEPSMKQVTPPPGYRTGLYSISREGPQLVSLEKVTIIAVEEDRKTC